jgi:hypothetical protein
MTNCLITASRLVILRRRPLSVIGTASFSNVARFFAPGGRPRGLLARRFCRNPLIIALRPGRHVVLSW